ncbi:MAG: 3-deoxy-7-phosphoheptulonate synthase, partial [Candidatus Gracilibacteria bacterium]|nr:3-deoxy-7-phosphoheptulonate synthase [Candidatus Gracilibacteria bacterium]
MPNSKITGKINLQQIKEKYQLSSTGKQVVQNGMQAIKDIFYGKDPRKLLIIGPCSADFEESLEEYAEFIADSRKKYGDKLEIIMRFYAGKPRTIGGWKGMIQQEIGKEID